MAKKKDAKNKPAPGEPKKKAPRGKPFVSKQANGGELDPRINTSGRPAHFDALRFMALGIATELATDRTGQPLPAPDGHNMTVAEVILRSMAQDPDRQEKFLQIGYGKVPDQMVLSNVDFTKLTDEQLRRIQAGENVIDVLLSTAGGSSAGTPPASSDRNASQSA